MQAAEGCQDIWHACLKQQANDKVTSLACQVLPVQSLHNPAAERMHLMKIDNLKLCDEERDMDPTRRM